MAIDERIPDLSDQHLTTLQGNARRIALTGAAKQKEEAERLLPLIQAELDLRKSRLPPRKTPVRKTPVRKKVAAKPG